MVFLLLGAVVNVAVAWGCARWSSFHTGRSSTQHEIFPLFSERAILAPDGMLDGNSLSGFGIATTEAAVSGTLNGETLAGYLLLFDSGWPLRAFRAEWRGRSPGPASLGASVSLRYGLPTADAAREGQFYQGSFTYPTHPIWPGFAINTFFYATVLWLLFAFPFTLRRWRRIRRGLCAKCAYPVGANDVCTECGTSIVRRRMGLPPPATPAPESEGASAT